MKYLYHILLLAFSSSVFGSDAVLVKKWIERFNVASDLRAVFGDDSIELNWPEIKANNHIDYLENPALRADIELLTVTFINQIKAHDAEVPVKYDTLRNTVGFYADIADRIEMSGGYSNYVIAGSLRGLALSRISYALVVSPDNVDGIVESFGLLKQRRVSNRFLMQLNREEIATNDNHDGVELSEDRRKNVSALYSYFGKDEESLEQLFAMRIDLFSAKNLLDRVSIPNLVYRMAFIDMLTQCHIPGLIYFLQKGGHLGDINLSDITNFRRVMGTSVTSFSDPGMGINSLNAGHLYVFIEAYRNPDNYRNDPLSALAF